MTTEEPPFMTTLDSFQMNQYLESGFLEQRSKNEDNFNGSYIPEYISNEIKQDTMQTN